MCTHTEKYKIENALTDITTSAYKNTQKNKIQQSFFHNHIAACFLLDTQHHMFRLTSQPSSGDSIQRILSVGHPYGYQLIRSICAKRILVKLNR
jgi:hypothetical protein